MWSKHSRRIEPMSLSTYAFCQGDRNAIGRSRMPMAHRRCTKTDPYEVSRSRMRFAARGPMGKPRDLARDPLRSRVFRHAKRQPNSSSVPYDDKTIKHPERDRWKDKKVDRRKAVGMVAQKRAPALRRWQPAAAHIPSNRRLSDFEAELEQFAMNVWGAPERVRPAHLANERA